jgi:hypothetical protein
MEYYSIIEEGNPSISNNMSELGEHYIKWNKPDTERQIPHFHLYMESKEVELIEWLPERGEREKVNLSHT